MPWNPDLYHTFQRERSAPFEDLLRLVNIREGLRVVDLGCGTGELTKRLADALPGSDVLGIDSSPDMLERAAVHAQPGLRFMLGDIATLTGDWDLIFSHAAIHWLEDHDVLVPWLFSMVRSGGQLAVQVPSNHSHPTHTIIKDVASEEPFRTALDGWTRTAPVLSIERYAELLYACGARELTVFEKIYAHELEDADALANWTSGTALVPYFERMPEELHEAFMIRYRAQLRALYPSSPVFYPFCRTLFAATKSL